MVAVLLMKPLTCWRPGQRGGVGGVGQYQEQSWRAALDSCSRRQVGAVGHCVHIRGNRQVLMVCLHCQSPPLPSRLAPGWGGQGRAVRWSPRVVIPV